MNNIIITGANGFIGSHLVDKLSKSNKVYALDRYSRNPQFNINKNIYKIKIDLFNNHGLKKLLNEIQNPYIFEFIGSQTPTSSFNSPLFENSYIRSIIERLDLYVKYKVKRIIFPSSAGTVYQITTKNKYTENDSINPSCPYGLSKYSIEKYLEYYKNIYNLDYLIFRISSVFGPRQNFTKDQGVIVKFLYSIIKYKKINVFGNLNSARDFIYIEDVVDVISKVFYKEHNYFIYNLGSGYLTTLSELIQIITKSAKLTFKINKFQRRIGDNQQVGICIERLVKDFNIKPKNNLKSNLIKTYNYINSINNR